jgi:hypothetical protein
LQRSARLAMSMGRPQSLYRDMDFALCCEQYAGEPRRRYATRAKAPSSGGVWLARLSRFANLS